MTTEGEPQPLSGSGRLTLRSLVVADENEALRIHEAMPGDDFLLFYESGSDWSQYVEQLEQQRLGLNLVGRRVPSTFLVAIVDGHHIVGRTSIRHELNDFLATVGGHIGYGVAPWHRRKGYATEILRQSIDILHSLGVEEVLVTCDEGNTASARTIERCGGQYEFSYDDHDGPPKRRYWFR